MRLIESLRGERHRCRLLIIAFVSALLFEAQATRADPATRPTTAPAGQLSIPIEEQGFDASQYATDDWFGARSRLDAHGIDIEPYLIVDYSKVFMGGLDTRRYSIRERFNLPVQADTGQLFGLQGGTIFAVLQAQRGGNASRDQVGDAQNFSFG